MGLLTFKAGDALMVIDVQNDFCPGGKLPIEGGDEVVPVLNEWIEAAVEMGVPVFFSRDWHPAGHLSFREHGGEWPPHCLQDSEGARFHPDLKIPENSVLVTKGVRFDRDQNSAFDQTGLTAELRRAGIRRLIVGGLAQDVCVLSTVIDARRDDFDVVVLLDATRPVTSEGGRMALERLRNAGAEIIGKSAPLQGLLR